MPENTEKISKSAIIACTSLERIIIKSKKIDLSEKFIFPTSAFKEIVFEGTLSEWSMLSKYPELDVFNEDFDIVCTDGKIEY